MKAARFADNCALHTDGSTALQAALLLRDQGNEPTLHSRMQHEARFRLPTSCMPALRDE